MRPCTLSTLIVCISLTVSGAALAQGTASVDGTASARSSAAVSADRDGAKLSHSGATSGRATTQHGSVAVAQGTEMDAILSKPVDARKAKSGDEVTATLAHDVRTGSGVTLRRGTRLVGHVTEAKAHDRHRSGRDGDSRLGIVFDKAILKDGRAIPVNAWLEAVAASEAQVSNDLRGFDAAAHGAGQAYTAGGLAGGGGALGGGALGGGLTGTVAAGARGTLGAGQSVVGRASGAFAGSASGAFGSSAARGASAGAIGGLGAGGRLTSGSRGVFALRGIEMASMTGATGRAGGSVLTSRSGNVALRRGTQMLLVANTQGNAGGAASE